MAITYTLFVMPIQFIFKLCYKLIIKFGQFGANIKNSNTKAENQILLSMSIRIFVILTSAIILLQFTNPSVIYHSLRG